MIEWVKRFFGQPGSSATAKERLRLVLMTDHLELAPELVDAMKRDLVDVISRYVEVDRERIEVNFEHQDRSLAMLANIPILSVNRPSKGEAEKTTAPPAVPVDLQAAEPALSVASAPNVASPGAHAATTTPAAELPDAAPPTRKRRRRKRSQTVASALSS